MLRYIKKRVNRGEVGESGESTDNNGTPNSSGHTNSLADEVYRPLPMSSLSGSTNTNATPKTAAERMRFGSKDFAKQPVTMEQLQEQQRHLDETILSQQVDHLANFDACIEACDALAAASSSNAGSRRDPKTNLIDCSVLVSPDGDLLLNPQQGIDGSMHELGEEYESAISVGYDLQPNADQTLNGFTANGWSIPAASLALRQTEQSLHDFADFCEEIVLSKKESAAKFNVACDKLRAVSFERGPQYPEDLQKDAQLMKTNPDFALTKQRVGPMLFNGGTLHRAQVKLEEFYASLAENESDRWRLASLQRKGALPPLRKAATLAEERSSNRQKTLRELYRRVQTMEEHLQACQALSKAKWKAVEDADNEVSRLMSNRLKERNRRLEDARLKEFQKMGEQQETAVGGATNSEIWDIVSQVNSDIENGSFEPISFQQSMAATMQAQAQQQRPSEELAPSGVTEEPASRMDIEDELGMGQLRAAAFAADRMVQSASQSLLSVLSSLDQVRRSARISAETNLLSACNAQASCIKALVRLERAAAEERLKQLEEVERYVNQIDVRQDLDVYITEDRKRPGGSAPLGQDDDGGVASALAILTSHVDGEAGSDSTGLYGNNSKSNKESIAAKVTIEQVEEALESLFHSNEFLEPDAPESEERQLAQEKFQESVQLLCDVATEKSNPARPKRSRMCYALNAKRSSQPEVKTPLQFDALCKVFSSILSGCDCETGGVSNAKMCMMLSQTFFFVDKGGKSDDDNNNNNNNKCTEQRSRRIYVKNRLIGHELWSNDEFWDQVLFQCLSESLTNSGVMTNFERSNNSNSQLERTENGKMQWYDLSPIERTQAASQVHAVVFAQLSALAHSMIEFGCGLERSCAFVRRMAIRNQLPLSQRTILLQHLVSRKNDSESERVALLDQYGAELESEGSPNGESINVTEGGGVTIDDGAATKSPPAAPPLPDQLKSHIDH